MKENYVSKFLACDWMLSGWLLLGVNEISGVAIREETAVLANFKSTKERNQVSPSVVS